jgi:type 1 glutamine amidotransferase
MSLAVLVFSRTTGFRHDSIAAGVAAIADLGARGGFAVLATEDPAEFHRLGAYQVVVFLNTSGDVLDEPQRAAFEAYIRAGGGYVGVHSASNTEYEWPFYGALVGAYFDQHPDVQEAAVTVADSNHPATAHLPSRWVRTDEWYDFRSNVRGQARVLLTLDESSYVGGRMGQDHPFAWCHESLGGRAFYTAAGHTDESYADPNFREHLLGGIRWAAKLA